MSHGTDTLLLQMFTIFVCAKICGEVFERLSLPAVLGEILAGIALGPYAANIIVPSDTIVSLAEIGAIFLLFTVGLETSPHELIRIGGRSLNVAIAGIVLPFVCGLFYLKLSDQSTHEAAFVAAAMVATSVGITARILQDMQVLKNRAAKIILGAAVFDDILGMVLLGVGILTGMTAASYLGEAHAQAWSPTFRVSRVIKRVPWRVRDSHATGPSGPPTRSTYSLAMWGW